jgi:hypothetical protein
MTRVAAVIGSLIAMGPSGSAAQELADFDYENLSFRGIGVDVGRLWANRVEPTSSVGLRIDMGYLGPGVRLTPSVRYWSSQLKASQVMEFESSLAELIVGQDPGSEPEIDLGNIDWSDLRLGLDAHVVWSVPFDLLTYMGAGAGVHFLNGEGTAISGTFVEDLLDSARAGVNAQLGIEYPWERFRVFGEARYELLEDLNYFELRIGGQIMFGPSAPGELGG